MRSCPFGHECNSCHLQVTLRGLNPQTGHEIDDTKCALSFLPILLIENSQQQRQTAAAVESFRNEMVRDNGALGHIMQNLLERPQ